MCQRASWSQQNSFWSGSPNAATQYTPTRRIRVARFLGTPIPKLLPTCWAITLGNRMWTDPSPHPEEKFGLRKFWVMWDPCRQGGIPLKSYWSLEHKLALGADGWQQGCLMGVCLHWKVSKCWNLTNPTSANSSVGNWCDHCRQFCSVVTSLLIISNYDRGWSKRECFGRDLPNLFPVQKHATRLSEKQFTSPLMRSITDSYTLTGNWKEPRRIPFESSVVWPHTNYSNLPTCVNKAL